MARPRPVAPQAHAPAPAAPGADRSPLVLRPGRTRGWAFIIIGLAFAAYMAWSGPGGSSPFVYWGFAVIIVGLWIGFGIYMVDPAHYLRLDATGMLIHSLCHSAFYTWQDLNGFYAEGTPEQPMVTFDLVGVNPQDDAWTRATHLVMSGREVLPSTYGRSAEDLAQLLNAWRGRYSLI